jgi:hypothetical protein
MIETHTVARFIGSIFNDNVSLIVLEIPERKEDNVSLVDPDLRRSQRLANRKKDNHTFLRIFPRICANRFSPSKH